MEQLQKITQAYSQTPWRKQVRMIGIFLLVLVVVATVASVYLNVRARTVALGRELQWMQIHLIDYYAIRGETDEELEKKAQQSLNQEQEEEQDDLEEIIPIEELQRNISLLQTQLAFLTSYSVMAERAQEMGLVPAEPEDIVYLEIPGYVEQKSVVLAPPPQPAVVSASGIDPAFRQSLFEWLTDQIHQTFKFFNGVKP